MTFGQAEIARQLARKAIRYETNLWDTALAVRFEIKSRDDATATIARLIVSADGRLVDAWDPIGIADALVWGPAPAPAPRLRWQGGFWNDVAGAEDNAGVYSDADPGL